MYVSFTGKNEFIYTLHLLTTLSLLCKNKTFLTPDNKPNEVTPEFLLLFCNNACSTPDNRLNLRAEMEFIYA